MFGGRNLIFVFILLLAACGRYGKPLAPELFSPGSVKEIKAQASIEGVRLFWKAPAYDFRGKELKSLDGYIVYRKELQEKKKDVEFDELTIIEDQHIALLQRLKKEARAAGKPARKIKVEESLKNFEYLDTEVDPGSIYVYKIVPFNQGDVKGAAKQQIRVIFRGDASEVEVFADKKEKARENDNGDDETFDNNSF